MREREPLTSITRKHVLNRFDQGLQNHRHWSEEGFQLRGDHGREDRSTRFDPSIGPQHRAFRGTSRF
jgi:hypothetical protein